MSQRAASVPLRPAAGERNHLLRQARLRTPSPENPERPMSQRELAEAITAYVQRTTGRDVAVDRHYISRWERGQRRWPNADYRAGFRAVLGAGTDVELGFYRVQRSNDDVMGEGITLPMPVSDDEMPMQLVVKPGTAVIVVPADHPVLLALVGGMEPGV
jgi:transcriptional regulator with XRE-family HTH domain